MGANMSITSLERVMWRLRKTTPKQPISPVDLIGKSSEPLTYTNIELRRAIMMEIGTDLRTYQSNRKALKVLGWINMITKKRFVLTNVDQGG